MVPERLLLGPGPSPVSPRVMRALTLPVLSHLDPAMMAILDDVRGRLAGLFGAGPGALTFAVSGTGTSGMEAAVANVVRPGARAIAVVNGYFGERLAEMLTRYGADVTTVTGEWGRACDPAAVEARSVLKGNARVTPVAGSPRPSWSCPAGAPWAEAGGGTSPPSPSSDSVPMNERRSGPDGMAPPRKPDGADHTRASR